MLCLIVMHINKDRTDVIKNDRRLFVDSDFLAILFKFVFMFSLGRRPLENTYNIRGYIAYVQTSRPKDTYNIFRMFVDSSALSDQCPSLSRCFRGL